MLFWYIKTHRTLHLWGLRTAIRLQNIAMSSYEAVENDGEVGREKMTRWKLILSVVQYSADSYTLPGSRAFMSVLFSTEKKKKMTRINIWSRGHPPLFYLFFCLLPSPLMHRDRLQYNHEITCNILPSRFLKRAPSHTYQQNAIQRFSVNGKKVNFNSKKI